MTGAEESLGALLEIAKPLIVAYSKQSKSSDRCKCTNVDQKQLHALRKATLVLSAEVSSKPHDLALRDYLGHLLDILYTSSFPNSGLIAQHLAKLDIDEPKLLSDMDAKFFSHTNSRNKKFNASIDAVLEKMNEKRAKESEPEPPAVNQQQPQNGPFMTAKSLLSETQRLKQPQNNGTNQQVRRNLGGKRWAANPKDDNQDDGRGGNEFGYYNLNKPPQKSTPQVPQPQPQQQQPRSKSPNDLQQAKEEPVDERLQGIEPRLIEMIENEIKVQRETVTWDSIAGLEHAKKTIFEIVIWPMLRPYPSSCLFKYIFDTNQPIYN